MTAGRGQPGRTTFVLHLHGLERAAEAGPGAPDHYPPYDLVHIRGGGAEAGEDTLRLVFAVAGFTPEQLEITVAGDQLFIRGEQSGDAEVRHFLHRGIATRRFRRAFRLAPGLEVERADLDRGLLSVILAVRAARINRTIAIGVTAPVSGPSEPLRV